MIRYFFLLLLCLTLNAKESRKVTVDSSLDIARITENDPSSYVDGVNMMTGDFYLHEEDYTVQGAEPIHLSHSYISSRGEMNDYPHIYCCFIQKANCFCIREPNGSTITYIPEGHDHYPIIGKDFYYNYKRPLKYSACDEGISNTASGKISAQTNRKNQYLLLDPTSDPKGKSFTLFTSDGTKRRYINVEAQEKIKPFPDAVKQYIFYNYKLVSEELPNGHVIHYEWYKNSLRKIRTGSRNRDFASIVLFPIRDFNTGVYSLYGSDQRSLSYNKKTVARGLQYDFINGPEHPKEDFQWSVRDKRPFLTKISLPNGRFVSIDYNDQNRVKSLSSPIGVTYTFSYDEKNRSSASIDAKGNKTAYYWDENYRLTQIDRYSGVNKLLNSERYLWKKSELVSKSLLDENQNVVRAIFYGYDQFGNILEEAIQGNLSGQGRDERYVKTMTYAQDARHLLQKESYPNGLAITYSYWPNTNLLESKTIWGGAEKIVHYSYEYDEDYLLTREMVTHQSIKEIIPVQEELYAGLPRVVLEKSSDGKLLKKTVLQYTKGALVSQKDVYDGNDELRYSLLYTYDEKGRLLSETNPMGQRAEYRYDEVGNRWYSKDFGGRQETYCKYDLLNRLKEKEEVGSDGVRRIFRYGYDEKNQLIEEIDDRDNVTRYEYDALGNKTKTVLPLGSVIVLEYDASGNEIKKIDAAGYITTASYNAYRKPIFKTHPDGSEERWSYYLDGNLKTYTDQNGVDTTYEYDYLGRIKSKKISNCEETYEYEGLNLISKTDFEGNKTVYTYDLAGRKIAEECCGERIQYAYDSLGRLNKIQEGDLVTIKEYDLLDRIIEERKESITGELLRQEFYEYDSAGNRSAVVKGEGREELEYDSLGRLIRKKDALGHIETVKYENIGSDLRKTHTDAMGLQTIEIYNAQNLLISIEKKKNDQSISLEEKSYDLNGHLKTQINSAGSKKIITSWEYDPLGRTKTLIEASGAPEQKITQFTYTPRGELEDTIKPDRTTLHRKYNDLGQLILITSTDGTVNYSLRHNRLGHLISSENLYREVDHRGRILKDNYIVNTFDNRGRRTSLTMDRQVILYEHNALDLKKVTWNDKVHNYLKYDLCGRVLEEELINGQIITHSYDPLHKTGVSHLAFRQKVLQFDAVGNICCLEHQNEKIDYSYDDLYQLISETGPFSHSYGYDALYNRLQKDEEEYRHNALNQITSHVEYDLNGNPIRIRDMSLSYDALDRLIRIETPQCVQIFEYDCLNRCIAKTNNEKKFFYIYDGQKEIGAYDENGYLVEFRVLGNAPHAEIGASVAIYCKNTIYAPIHDLTGSIAVLLGPQKPIYYRYSAFGEELKTDSLQCPWRFSSKRTDDVTGLVYFGRRFYAPDLGRWLTPDPAGYVDGINLYAYVHNDPLTHFDEYGLIDYGRTPQRGNFTNALYGFGHGCLDFTMGYFHDIQRSLAYIGSDSLGMSLHGKIQMFDRMKYYQDNRMSRVDDWVTNQFSLDRTNSVYQSFRSKTTFGLEVGSFLAGGYGAVKGAIAFNRLAKMPGQITRVSKVLSTRLPKTTLANSKSWTHSINPFKGKTFQEIDRLLRSEGFTVKGPDPLHGKGSYFSPTTNRKYYLDYAGKTYKGGTIELPHVDVHYNIPVNGIEKQRFPIGEYLYEFE